MPRARRLDPPEPIPSGARLPADPASRRWFVGAAEKAVESRLAEWATSDAVGRIWRKEPSFWPAAPATDVASRLGWLRAPEQSVGHVAELQEFADRLANDGVERLGLFGMGGSSLAAEVLAQIAPGGRHRTSLSVLDSTHPHAVREAIERLPPARSLYLVSSKSGTTLEPSAFFHTFWAAVSPTTDRPGQRFAAITDPGTPLEKLARERGFRACWLAPPDVGGRYSALTVFGLVPAAVAGVDLEALLASARAMVARCAEPPDGATNPGLRLGAALGELARTGRDKVVFLTSPSLRPFPAWAEQLIAESLGKQGRGIVPVAQAPPTEGLASASDVLYVYVGLEAEPDRALEDALRAQEDAGVPVLRFVLGSPTELGAEFFRWEFAVAACGAILGIDPFDQPDVEHAKELARQSMSVRDGGPTKAVYGATAGPALSTVLEPWLRLARPGDYVAVQAFLAPTRAIDDGLHRLVVSLRRRLGIVVTQGYGPRFLHSTGQLHKGGPASGLFLQLVDEPPEDVPVPELGLTFARIVRAQAKGDAGALEEHQRRLLVLNLGGDAADGLSIVTRTVQSPGPRRTGSA